MLLMGKKTILTFAIQEHSEKVFELLISSRAAYHIINYIDYNGETVLTLAIQQGLNKICEMLIPKMSEQAINQVNNNGDTALTLATGKGLEKVCKALIPKMSNEAINHVNKSGDTVLTVAAERGLEKVCKALISKMSSEAINKVTNNGETALTLAAYKGLEKVCKALIPKMTDQAINHVNNSGDTALSIAKSKGFTNIFDLLINKENHPANKTYAEKKHEEQQQNIKLKPADLANNENKLADIKDLTKEEPKLDLTKEKLAIFQNIVVEITGKLKGNTAINEKDKDVMKVNIREIVNKVERLDNKSDIEAITENVKELISGKITKARIAVVEEDVEQLIEQQNKLSQSIIFNKVEETKELSQIDANKEQTFNLIQQAMNNNDEELVLAGLTSLANDQAPTAD